jgi:hypothetical protein
MIAVVQTRTGENGNCFAACLASILEVPLHVVPEFGGDDVWLDNIQAFLAGFGLYYVQVASDDPIIETAFAHGEVFHTIEGTSPRGGQHAVVGLNGSIVHDPHPEDGTGRGLVEVDTYGLLCAQMARPAGGVNLSGVY